MAKRRTQNKTPGFRVHGWAEVCISVCLLHGESLVCSCVCHGAAAIWVISAQAVHQADQRVRGSSTQIESPVLNYWFKLGHCKLLKDSRSRKKAKRHNGTVTFFTSTGKAEPVSRLCAMLFVRGGHCIFPPWPFRTDVISEQLPSKHMSPCHSKNPPTRHTAEHQQCLHSHQKTIYWNLKINDFQ